MPGMMNYQISQNIKILLFSPPAGFLDLFECKEHAWNDELSSKYQNFTIFATRRLGPILNFYNLWFSRLI